MGAPPLYAPICLMPLLRPHRTQVFNDENHRLDVYGQDVEVDYRGYEVTVENFMRVLTGEKFLPPASMSRQGVAVCR
jgi:glycosylphosphatidylinositol transamidase (GPIT) subunit GPI8